MTFAPGEYIGPYRIIEPLGQGGMATVFKAYHAMLDRYVAIKALHPAFKEDPSFLTRFEREARIVAKLDHPNIIPIYDFAEHEGTPYLVMRYIEGETLKTLLTQQPMPLERVLEILNPVADALSYAHSQGVLHRDIKPSNILLSNDDHIYLTDFGLARTTQPGSSTLSRDMLIGTPQYISPEQAKSEPVDERSDIYSLGVVLFEMLTGQVPFSGDTPYSVIHDHIYTPLPMPSSINPKLSPEVERATLKALAKDPDARYRDARDLLQALEQAGRARSSRSNRSAVLRPGTGRAFPLRRALLGIDILFAILLVGLFLLNPEARARYPVRSEHRECSTHCNYRTRHDLAGRTASAGGCDRCDTHSVTPTDGGGDADQHGDAVPAAILDADGDAHGDCFTGPDIHADAKIHADDNGNAAAIDIAHSNRVCLWNGRTDFYTFPDPRAARNGVGSSRRILDGSAGRRPKLNGG